jgi:hypothetical protein
MTIKPPTQHPNQLIPKRMLPAKDLVSDGEPPSRRMTLVMKRILRVFQRPHINDDLPATPAQRHH